MEHNSIVSSYDAYGFVQFVTGYFFERSLANKHHACRTVWYRFLIPFRDFQRLAAGVKSWLMLVQFYSRKNVH